MRRMWIYKKPKERLWELFRDYTGSLIVDFLCSENQPTVYVAIDPFIEKRNAGMGGLEKKLGVVDREMILESIPEDEKAEGISEVRYPELHHVWVRYPFKSGKNPVEKFSDYNDVEGYCNCYPPLVVGTYNIPDFLTLRRFRKEVRKLPHATIIKTERNIPIRINRVA